MADKLSTVPGLATRPKIQKKVITAYSFLEGRRKLDGAEGLWRIGDRLYDLEKFIKNHPGGPEWISLTRGTDITDAFEAHHLSDKAEKLLPKFYVRDAKGPRSAALTFRPNGFFQTFKRRAKEILKDVDYHRPSTRSNLIADSLIATAYGLSILAAMTQSYVAMVFAAIFLAWTTVTGHNYFHMRDSFRMYYFDIVGPSSKEWRISHVMSHHIYPNTIWDYEVLTVEPLLQWFPYKDKSAIGVIFSQLISPVIWSALFFNQLFKRYYGAIYEYRQFEFRDAVPLFLLGIVTYFAPSFLLGLKTWFLLVAISSFVFGLIGFNAAHHHPDIFHDGDVYRDDLDWGLLELDAVRERKVIDDHDFLVLTNFGQHHLHHLLPTVDHCYLRLLDDAFAKTCQEFGISFTKLTQWDMLKGQFQQLARREPKKNYR